MILLLQIAGVLLLLLALSSVFTPKILRYRENMERVDATVREVFNIHNLYVTFYIGAFAALCLVYPRELAGTGMGRFLCGFASITWWIRLGIQVFYHNAQIKRDWPVMNVVYMLTFVYLGAAFGMAAADIEI